MSDVVGGEDLSEALAAFGSDLSRWPPERASRARERLLRDRAFRTAWEGERRLDRELAAHREELDREIAAAGALGRVRSQALARLPAPAVAIGWRRLAAAMLVASLAGGALDLFLTGMSEQPAEVVMLDPLYGLAETEIP